MIYKEAFYVNKNTGGNDYNFDLSELCKNFSFFDFIHSVQSGTVRYNGGFLVCTPKQYIVGYNARFGSGTHNASFARFMKDIHGGGIIASDAELIRLSDECKNNYLYAKMLFENIDINIFNTNNSRGFIDFYIPIYIENKGLECRKDFIMNELI